MTTVYKLTATRLKKTSTHMTRRQFAILAKTGMDEVREMKRTGQLSGILDASGLILADKARAWVMRNVKRQKKEAKA